MLFTTITTKLLQGKQIFGTFAEPRLLMVFYEGQEDNPYQTEFGALKGGYIVNDKVKLGFAASIFHTVE